MAGLSKQIGLWIFAGLSAIGALEATPACIPFLQEVSIKLGHTEVRLAVAIEEDSFSPHTTFHWKIVSHGLRETPNEGYLDFCVDPTSPPRIELNRLYGARGLPGLGTLLKRRIRELYPQHEIISSLRLLNAKRILEAIHKSPRSPDFSNVPAITALNEDFELKLNIARNSKGVPEIREITLRTLAVRSGERGVWLNPEELFADPLFAEWISTGAKGSSLLGHDIP